MIEIKNVSYAYRVSDTEGRPILRPAVKDLNLKIHSGEFLVLTGSSGCGKTTVCRLINGLIPHYSIPVQYRYYKKRRKTMTEHYIHFRDVVKSYGSGNTKIHALDGVSFDINKGEFCILLGSSGAGKTTLLNMLGGMDTITSGEITFDGKNISSLTKRELVEYRRHDVGFVFQFYNLIPNLTALENVEIAAQLCKNPIPAKEALAMVGLTERADNFPAQLSGGEQQRVAIARALAKNPRLLLCDEPTGALDYVTGKAVLKLLYDLSRERGTTVIIITHNQAIAPMADRIIRIKSGKIRSNEINEHIVPIDEIEW